VRRSALAFAFAMLAVLPAFAEADRCAAPAELTRIEGSLPRTAAKLRGGGTLTVVAIGSSSTAGFGASAPSKSYPARLAAELERLFPQLRVRMHNRGVGGEDARDMVRRFDRDVFAEKPDLVIWQVGTNSVVRDESIDRVAAVVRDGVERVKTAGIDTVLMTTQYAPKVIARPRHLEMERLLDTIGREEKVGVFHRFALMHHWVTSGQLDFKRMLSPDGLHLNDASYACIARHLATAIAERTRDPERAVTSQR
jgi:lysophospholipase L1-like esterase